MKGHLDLLLIAIVADEPAHGYRIVEELRTRSAGAFDLSEGTVYPALYRLERVGMIRSRWSQDAGRRRRVYAVTRRGAGEFERREREWHAFRAGVDAVLATVP